MWRIFDSGFFRIALGVLLLTDVLVRFLGAYKQLLGVKDPRKPRVATGAFYLHSRNQSHVPIDSFIKFRNISVVPGSMASVVVKIVDSIFLN
jgi:hypothetical protein